MSEVILTKEHLADLWKKIATEFKDYKNIWGYDLMNEPKGIDINVLFDDYQTTINAIREVDTNAQIVVEGKNYAGAAGWEGSSDKLKVFVEYNQLSVPPGIRGHGFGLLHKCIADAAVGKLFPLEV